jgi:hypothetical protein
MKPKRGNVKVLMLGTCDECLLKKAPSGSHGFRVMFADFLCLYSSVASSYRIIRIYSYAYSALFLIPSDSLTTLRRLYNRPLILPSLLTFSNITHQHIIFLRYFVLAYLASPHHFPSQ